MKKPTWAWLWVVLLLKANHKENNMIWNNNFITVKEGQFITGRKEISRASGIPESTIEDILKFLEKSGQIQQQKTTKYRLITIIKWQDYQTSDNKATTKQQQSNTNKNDNKDKKDTVENKFSTEGADLVKSFEFINPSCKRMYNNKTQRQACEDLIKEYTFERVKTVIEQTLIKTNQLPYFPNITTPVNLRDKWSALESAIIKHRSENTLKNKVAFN